MFIKIGNDKVESHVFQVWLDALRSGKFAQTKDVLQDKDGYCCLGVACEVLVPEYPRHDVYNMIEDNEGYEEEGELIGTFMTDELPSEPDAPEWLVNINDDFSDKTGQGLSDLNDKFNFSFESIAELLDLVYLQGISVDLHELSKV